MKERGNLWLRILDHYIGIPVVFLLSFLKKKIEANVLSSVHNIIVLKLGTIGDTILVIPILKAIKIKYPQASLTVVGSKNNQEILKRFEFIDSLESLNLSRVIREPQYLLEFVKKLNQKQNDIIFDFEPWPRVSAIITSLIKGRLKIGFQTEGQHRHFVFDISIPHSDGCHEIENYISLAKSADIEVLSKDLDFPILDDERTAPESFLIENRINHFVVLHLWGSGYRGHLREWGIKDSVEFVRSLIKEGYDVVVTGVNDDASKAHEIVKAVPDRFFSVCGKFTLGETACLIKKSALLVTVNTGIMHLGAALNHPMIALHGPTSVLRWGPVGSSRFYNIESPMECAPCLHLGFEYGCKNGACMDKIRPEIVVKKALEMLGN